ncbi:MAG: hypothetical protein Q4F95_07480 [Oscillospiraceae bacterium]|nr:hypothetical protein [Oscillospiraceae bacterium]
MSITGEGTEANPWVVHTVAELREKAVVAGTFIKLANNLDCDTQYQEWETLSGNSSNPATIDFEGYKLDKPYIKPNNGLMQHLILKNGKVLNIHENNFEVTQNSCSFIMDDIYMYTMAVSADIDNFHEGAQVGRTDFAMIGFRTIDNCSIKINFENNNEFNIPRIFDSGTDLNTNLVDSQIIVSTPSALDFLLYCTYPDRMTITGNSFTAKTNHFAKTWGSDSGGYLINNTFNLTGGTGNLITASNGGTFYSREHNIYNTNISSFNTLSGLDGASYGQCVNPDYLLSIGFPGIKEV